ncbi:hypothetical protein LINPERHAP2_LOCUS13214, partial [Linum perenne]
DRNTKFYHLAALKRRAANRVRRLKDADGVWVEDEERLLAMAVDFFKSIYAEDGESKSLLMGFSGSISDAAKLGLTRPLAFSDIESAIKGMGALKAPGKDGFGPVFFQHS